MQPPCEACRWRPGWIISPNPARDVLHVLMEDDPNPGRARSEYVVTVTDLYGKTMYRSVGSPGNFELDVSQYREGVYTMRVWYEGEVTATNFVVSRE